MKTVTYGSCTIKSLPILTFRRWKVGIIIVCERDGMITMHPFSLESACDSEEGRSDGPRIARQIIDGKIAGQSVNW